jgi:hypothetical protein
LYLKSFGLTFAASWARKKTHLPTDPFLRGFWITIARSPLS